MSRKDLLPTNIFIRPFILQIPGACALAFRGIFTTKCLVCRMLLSANFTGWICLLLIVLIFWYGKTLLCEFDIAVPGLGSLWRGGRRTKSFRTRARSSCRFATDFGKWKNTDGHQLQYHLLLCLQGAAHGLSI